MFSYADSCIRAIGVVAARYTEAQRPESFGTGVYWDNDGLLVPLRWEILKTPLRPKGHFEEIRPLLPQIYSPLIIQNGNGNQKCYLAEISDGLALLLKSLVLNLNPDIYQAVEGLTNGLYDTVIEGEIENSDRESTLKSQLVLARVGQGVFRSRLLKIENCCRVTGVSNITMLIASHIKPWRFSNDFERLDGNNGLLLSPHVDRLFDRGYISFADRGGILVADDQALTMMDSWSIDPNMCVGNFSKKQIDYLAYHRENVFRRNHQID
ncbi:MAG: HNH endonuclease [Pseudogulbenkiania sp.]|nr:HNH endonuclease [Pseudogulbenkiania sp.]